jgi:hypothetical protein
MAAAAAAEAAEAAGGGGGGCENLPFQICKLIFGTPALKKPN